MFQQELRAKQILLVAKLYNHSFFGQESILNDSKRTARSAVQAFPHEKSCISGALARQILRIRLRIQAKQCGRRFAPPTPFLIPNQKVGLMSRLPDLNWGPSIYKIVALPTELRRQYYFLHLLIQMFFSLYAFTQTTSFFLVFGNCYQEAGNICLFSGLFAFLYYFIAYLFYLLRDFVCAPDP